MEGAHSSPHRLAGSINEARLWQRHMDLAQIGGTDKGGVNRQALTPEDNEARRVMVRWAREAGFACNLDDAGNLFIRRGGTNPDAAPVMTGSHLDTQPTGGKFDGIYGVLAGFEVLHVIEELGLRTRRPLDLVVWANEEGCRFAPACTGSLAFTDPAKLGHLLQTTDPDGVMLGADIGRLRATLSDVPRRRLGGEVAAYVEAHIEQGPVLEQSGKTVGVVTGIQGARDFRVIVTGEAAHAGTTPRRLRRDAFRAALAMAIDLYDVMENEDDRDILRFTIGRIAVRPNSPAVVPSCVDFTIDFRHPDNDVLRRLGDRVAPICHAAAGGCDVSVVETRWREPTLFASHVPDVIERSAEELGIRHMRMPSGASHDAVYLNRICPTGMIFVPCEGGISHNEAENADPADLADGTRVLANALIELSDR